MKTPIGYYKLESDRPKVGQEIKEGKHKQWKAFFGERYAIWGFPIFNQTFIGVDVSAKSDVSCTVNYKVLDDIADVPPHFCVHEVTFAKPSLLKRIKAFIWPRS